MRMTSKLLLGGLSLFLALPVIGSAAGGPSEIVSCRLPVRITKTNHVEVTGVLRRIDILEVLPQEPALGGKGLSPNICPPLIRSYWEITADGKTYRLDFGTRKDRSQLLAEQLNGKLVLVAGRLERRLTVPRGKNGIPIMSFAPVSVDTIIVNRLEAVQTEATREAVEVEVLGTLEYREGPRYVRKPIRAGREWEGYFVRVNGQEYLLQLPVQGKLAEEAAKLQGQRVVVRGRLESWSDQGGCVGGPRRYPLIVVTDLSSSPSAATSAVIDN